MAADRGDLVSIPGVEEVRIISGIYEALIDLPDGTQRRILDWVSSRIAHDHDIARSLRDAALREELALNQLAEEAAEATFGDIPRD